MVSLLAEFIGRELRYFWMRARWYSGNRPPRRHRAIRLGYYAGQSNTFTHAYSDIRGVPFYTLQSPTLSSPPVVCRRLPISPGSYNNTLNLEAARQHASCSEGNSISNIIPYHLFTSGMQHPLMPPLSNPLAIPIPTRPVIGTPFDPSPRFEYPFPVPPQTGGPHDYHPALVLPMSAYPHAHVVVRAPALASSGPASAPPAVPPRPLSASKRAILNQPSAPPVPPSLARRRDTPAKGRSNTPAC
jgi:hypothetical protein